MSQSLSPQINWPDAYRPSETAVHVRNELLIAAPAERIWAWLIRAPLWPTWYENSQDVAIEGGAFDLSPGARFSWKTFGLSIDSVVGEFVPNQRIGWTGIGTGMDVYHGWVIAPRDGGCLVLTEENQNGLGARAQSVLAPNRMHKHHQIWLESLQAKASQGMPPASLA
ncbi:SRPBCC domain-containing protein [Lichenicola sp.]|uniref:SRPBCC domain-containing protein n=1 Tax=Lichenicola sp. TaxID=2804529 RepID=UPI003B00A67F